MTFQKFLGLQPSMWVVYDIANMGPPTSWMVFYHPASAGQFGGRLPPFTGGYPLRHADAVALGHHWPWGAELESSPSARLQTGCWANDCILIVVSRVQDAWNLSWEHFRVEKGSISFCVEADNQRRYCQTAMTPIKSAFKSFALVVKHDVLESCSISWRFSMNLLSPKLVNIFWTATFDCKRARWLDDRDVMSNIPDQVEIPTMRSSRKLQISLLRPVSHGSRNSFKINVIENQIIWYWGSSCW